MRRYEANLVDYCCHSNSNNEISAGLFCENTLRESYKLIYFYGEPCVIDIDGKHYYTEKGDSALVFPCSEFEIEKKPGAKYAWLEFSGFESAAILSRVAFSRQTPVLGKIDMDGFEDLFQMPAYTGEFYSLYRLGGCLLLLLSYYIEKFPGSKIETESHVYRACQYIDTHYSAKSCTVKGVAEALKIDRSYLYRMFKDEIGISIIDYITRRRISKAEIMLSNSDLSIKDVAYSVGFSDQMYFSRVFKKTNGKSPTQFREMIFSQRE